MIALAAIAALTVSSSTFRNHGPLPLKAVHSRCGGSNVSPDLHWGPVPRGTRSFLLAVYDPDAKGGWYHWVAYNIPGSMHGLPAGVTLPPNELGTTSFGTRGYGGPCPPPGKVHHYYFAVYALNITNLPAGLMGRQLVPLIDHRVLGDGEIIGLYETRR